MSAPRDGGSAGPFDVAAESYYNPAVRRTNERVAARSRSIRNDGCGERWRHVTTTAFGQAPAETEELHAEFDAGLEIARAGLGQEHPFFVDGEARGGASIPS